MKLIGGMKFFTWVHIHNYAIDLMTCDEVSLNWREVITINCQLVNMGILISSIDLISFAIFDDLNTFSGHWQKLRFRA